MKYILLFALLLCGCQEPQVECRHTFGKWGPPEKTQDWNYGIRTWQSRTCSTCGLVEVRWTR